MQSFLPSMIYPSQRGFVRHRQSVKNIRTSIAATIRAETRDSAPLMLLSLEAEKAFDKVSWPFLTATLYLRQFGPNFRGFNAFKQMPAQN